MRSLTTLLLFPGVVLAQGNVRGGPFLGLPLHTLAGSGTIGPLGAPLSVNELYLKRAGVDQDVVPSPPFAGSGIDRPDFSLAAMFGPFSSSIELGAISSGFHTSFTTWLLPPLVIEPVPVLSVPANAWGAIFFSVTATSGGEPGGVVAQEVAAGGSAGGDVFSVILPQGNVPASLQDCIDVGSVQLANDSSEMGLQAGGAQELRDFDPFFTFYEAEGPLPSFMTSNPWIYFTLPLGVAGLHTDWYDHTPALASPASILRMQWTLATGWSEPELFLSHLELGLGAGDVIDALAVDELAACVVLSLAGAGPDQQLMVAYSGPLGGINPPDHRARTFLYDPTAAGPTPLERVTKILDSEHDTDIDAICTVDPNAVNNIPYKYFPYVYGCRDAAVFPPAMSASAWMVPGNITSRITVSVSGLQDAPGAGLVGFLLWGVPVQEWMPTAPVPDYQPFEEILGWTYVLATQQTGRVQIDWPTAALPGYLDFQWAMLDATGIYQSNVVGCRF